MLDKCWKIWWSKLSFFGHHLYPNMFGDQNYHFWWSKKFSPIIHNDERQNIYCNENKTETIMSNLRVEFNDWSSATLCKEMSCVFSNSIIEFNFQFWCAWIYFHMKWWNKNQTTLCSLAGICENSKSRWTKARSISFIDSNWFCSLSPMSWATESGIAAGNPMSTSVKKFVPKWTAWIVSIFVTTSGR